MGAARRRALAALACAPWRSLALDGDTGAGGDNAAALPEARGRVLDLVVDWRCEGLSWLAELPDDLESASGPFPSQEPSLTIFLYSNADSHCKGSAPQLPFQVVSTTLPVRGDGHRGYAQLHHVIAHYDDLADFTAFVQGDAHWPAMGPLWQRGGQATADAAVGSVLAEAQRANAVFTPIAPVLALDSEATLAATSLDPVTNRLTFNFVAEDYYNAAREILSNMFGGAPCDVQGIPWSPGMQYVVRRDRLLERKKAFWEEVRHLLGWCNVFAGYYERITSHLFNASRPAADLETWEKPLALCRDNQVLRVSPDLFQRSRFWRKRWGCEPRSAGLRFSRKMDLVVAWYCEDISWLKGLAPSLASSLTIFVYDKCDKETNSTVPELPFKVVVEKLPNKGRDGHTQVAHIVKHYDNLAEFTAFVQGGLHWTLKPHPPALHGWDTMEQALNELLPQAVQREIPFLPIVKYTAERGPIMWQDEEHPVVPKPWDRGEHISTFEFAHGDYLNGARELASIVFGGSPCDYRPLQFTPGMQYIIRGDVFRSRPIRIWETLERMLFGCLRAGWYFERITSGLFDATRSIVDPAGWRTPTFCDPGSVRQLDALSLDIEPRAAFWGSRWRCDPVINKNLRHLMKATPALGPGGRPAEEAIGGLGSGHEL